MSAPLAPPPRRVSAPTTLAYASGAIAYGIKDTGFGTFLLLFYNQVLGLSPGTVGLIIMAALVLDALIDPAVGALSDRTRGRWGRRHPWMYASAIPIAVGWLLLWHPPAMSQPLTCLWLFVTAVIVRSAVSCYEVPSQALTPELTGDYDERTRITAWRYLLGWAGGLLMLLLAYRVFLAPGPGYPNGLLRAAGYGDMALAGAVLMVAAIIISALGTHHEIKHLPKPVIARQSVRGHFRELGETMKNRAFVVLMLAGLAAYTNQGIGYAMANYMYSYVWQLNGALTVLPFMLMVSVVIAFAAAPIIGRRTSKPRAAVVVTLLGTILQMTPYVLRLSGRFPSPGAPHFLAIYFAFLIAANALLVSGFILGASMMADVVEESESRTGRRSEGVFFAGSFFVQKCTSGIGIFLAGAILSLARFPAKATPGAVPVATIDRLTLIYIVIYLTLGAIAALCFSRFPFGRTEHEARLARIAASAEAEGAPHSI
ncbi:sodium:melibiose symporter [Sphingomonas koreensis]|nr:sodium:melibiose symporter [Sphingomonas koreensis]